MSADNSKKSTVYVDVDEEITSIVDKVTSSATPIVALVLPKRASVLQSSVNMKLLKRAADQNDKQVVLITSESTLLPLAGMAGLYVASSLSSKPTLPLPPSENAEQLPKDPVAIEPDTTVGDVAPTQTSPTAEQEPATIEIDNSAPQTAGGGTSSKKKNKTNIVGKKGKLRVPNFNKFRVLLFAGLAALLLLILGWYWAYFIAPKAVVTLKGETSNISVNFDMVADTAATSLDEETGVIPAKNQELKKTDTEKVAATGQKDKGNKASGTMTMKNCSQSDGALTIPAGSGVSSGEFTFITQAAVTLDPSVFSGGGTCLSSTKDVSVIAQNPGDKYNVSARSYSVAGFGGVNANGSAMSGGTSQVVKVVSASDVESAKQKLTAKQGSFQDELKKNLKKEGFIAIGDTFNAGTPKISVTPAVDSEASEVSVTSETTYTMLGVKEDDLKNLIKKAAGEQIDTQKQAILSYGIDDASYKLGTKKTTRTPIGVQAQIVAGPEIDQNAIKKDIAGKKRGEAEQAIAARPGIKEVRIETKPFWIYSVPKKDARITIVIQESDGTTLKP